MSQPSLIDLIPRAIADLTACVTRCRDDGLATDEARNEAIKAAEKARDRALHAATEARDTAQTRADKTLEQSRASITQDYEHKTASLRGQAQQRRESILDEAQDLRSHAAKKHDDAQWLAESLYEGALAEPEKKLKRVEHECTETQRVHDDVLQRAATLRGRLRLKARDVPEIDASVGPESPDEVTVDTRLERAQDHLERVEGRRFVRILRRLRSILLLTAGGLIGWFVGAHNEAPWPGLGIGLGAGLVTAAMAFWMQRRAMASHIAHAEILVAEGVMLAKRRVRVATKRVKRVDREVRQERDSTLAAASKQLGEDQEIAGPRSQRRLEKLETHTRDALQALIDARDEGLENATTTHETAHTTAATEHDEATAEAHTNAAAHLTSAEATCAKSWDALTEAWTAGLTHWGGTIDDIARRDTALGPEWTRDEDVSPQRPDDFAREIRVGHVRVVPDALPGGLPTDDRLSWTGQTAYDLPVALDLSAVGGLRIECDEANREDGLAMLRTAVARFLATVPPGQVKLTIADPVGLGQNFAGFMHLADHDEADILDRIWTEPRHIEQRLTDLTEHMENVIQTYLRNEYDSIDAYNSAAGEIAEPYHVLVLADVPEGLTETGAKRLASIISSGPRCGVFTLMLRDPARELPELLGEIDLDHDSVRIGVVDGEWRVISPSLQEFAWTPDTPPTDEALTALVHAVGAAAAGANRVEVPFTTIAPSSDDYWTRSTREEIRVALGQSGATRYQELRLGRGTTQHALIAGRTGSGKSTLLHVLITNLSMWCSPEELEFYLVDFKKGVEFQSYAMRQLPHARVVAIESDREFGLSVLQRLDRELKRRGELFRDLGVQDMPGWRDKSDDPMPRILLVVDEFQEFFTDDDTLAQEAGLLLDRLVRQGRAFGMHALMGSQTLDSANSLARSTLGQMGVRIALQCSEADSYLILSEDNPAARLLRRPGEAIYNDAAGKIEGNMPFQVVWIDENLRDETLDELHALDATHRGTDAPPRECFVFRGNIPSDLDTDKGIARLVEGQGEDEPTGCDISAVLGDPISIKAQTSVLMRRQSGGNVMLVGQHAQAANAVLTGMLLQAAARHAPAPDPSSPGLMAWVFDGQPPDAMMAGLLSTFAAELPHQLVRVSNRNVQEEMERLAAILAERQENPGADSARILLLGLETYRMRDLRPSEDDFSFSMDDEPAAVKPDAVLADLLRDGPAVGIHAAMWVDSLNNLNRALSRASQREFDQKILFQMGANDSGQLIDTTAASTLGMHRALIYTEETGVLEKFRPWAMPEPQWLQTTARAITARWG